MAGVYSKRFILASGTGPYSYTCPAGKRSIIKCITAMNGAGASVGASADIGGVYVWYGSIPGASTLVVTGLHVVMNAGDVFKLAATQTGAHFQASGYELQATP